jgi:YD repeat-containing protein
MTLYYITEEGIVAKKTNIMDFYTARDIAEGIIDISEELNIQKTLDKEVTVLIGSGSIELQRLSGYVTPGGISKIFFYDPQGLLKCMETSDNNVWKVTNNF